MLKKIYRLIMTKLTEIQIEDKFVKALEKERKLIYIDKPDNFFFQRMVDLIFQSGVRGVIWGRYEPEIRKEFADYDVKKVASYTEKNVDKMIANPKMFKNRVKIQACIRNAKQMVELSKEYGGFWKFLNSHTTQELVGKLSSTFKHFSHTNSYAFLRYVGMGVMKPDINVRRVLFRLGLIDSLNINQKTLKQIREVGERMAKAVGMKVTTIDYVLYMFGAGEMGYVKYSVCGVMSKCSECPLTNFCLYYKSEQARKR